MLRSSVASTLFRYELTFDRLSGFPDASFVPLLSGGSSFLRGSILGMGTLPFVIFSICSRRYWF